MLLFAVRNSVVSIEKVVEFFWGETFDAFFETSVILTVVRFAPFRGLATVAS